MSSGRVAGRGGGGGGGGRSRDQRTRPLVWVEAIQTWAGGWNLWATSRISPLIIHPIGP